MKWFDDSIGNYFFNLLVHEDFLVIGIAAGAEPEWFIFFQTDLMLRDRYRRPRVVGEDNGKVSDDFVQWRVIFLWKLIMNLLRI